LRVETVEYLVDKFAPLIDVISKPMPGKCSQCGSETYLGRTKIETDIIEIQNIPCTICEDVDRNRSVSWFRKPLISFSTVRGKGQLKTRIVVMSCEAEVSG